MEKTKNRRLDIVFESELFDKTNKTNVKKSDEKEDKNAAKGLIWQFIAIATIPLVLVLGNSMLVPILPQLQDELGITRFQSSLVISLFSVTAGLIIPISGYLSDRFSRKSVIIPSLIIYGAAGVLAGFGAIWKSYTILIMARALQGIGAAGTAPNRDGTRR
ncbi:MFS transporter [Paenibacillus hexagrammi]|uniref:MFS transporter n=1 Tax=Paenibacillus hexagrammi TaxID=2908839 RepID=UPI0033130245